MHSVRRTALIALVLSAGCSACTDAGTRDVVTVAVLPERTLAVGLGTTRTFEAVASDAAGRPLSRPVAWRSEDPSVATVDANGVATAVGAGSTTLVAEVDGVTARASLEVWIPESRTSWEPGTTYRGRAGYVEYTPGTLPLVVSVPHGGDLTPEEIADRTWGTLVTDARTIETALALRDAFLARTGHAPHLVVSRLKRTKLDPNREVDEAAQGDPFAENAWAEFHGFIEAAERAVEEGFGRGLYVDLHGHGHAVPRVELGYLLSAATLDLDDGSLDASSAADSSSIRTLAGEVALPFSGLLRGPESLGALLGDEGVAVVPGPASPSPGSDEYFTGGYATLRHGSRAPGSPVDGVQAELPYAGVRDTEQARLAFAAAFARAIEAWMTRHYATFLP